MFYSLLCQVYVLYISIKLCCIEDLRKSLYVLLMSIRSAFYSVICNLCLEIKLINLLCLIVSRVQHVLCWAETETQLKQKPAHPNVPTVYRNPLNRRSFRVTERKVVWYESNIVLYLFTVVSLCCFCLWPWKVSSQNVTKAKYDCMVFWSQKSSHFGLWDSWLSVFPLRYSIDPPSIPALPALTPVSNVAVRVGNRQTAAEEWREATLLQSQTAHWET